MMFYTHPEVARLWVDVVVSISDLGVGKFGKELVLANYSHAKPTIKSLPALEAALTRVEQAVAEQPGHAGEYMRILCRSQRAVLSILQGENRPYLGLVRDILDLEFRPIPSSEAEKLRVQLDEGLSKLGYRGTLQEKVDRWLEETSLTGEAVIDMAKKIVGATRQATLERVVKLPETEGLDSIYSVRNVHYSGRSQYTGNHRGWLHFNIDKNWQKDMFVQILCHEGYPGHQTFYCLWDVLFQEGRWPLEAAYYQLNNPTNVVFEGGPEVAMTFIDWDQGDSPDATARRVGQIFKDLHRIGMNNACLYANLGEMNRKQAVDHMVQHLTLRDDAERAYDFMTNPLARTNYPQYYYGRRVVEKAFSLMSGTQAMREKFYDIIYRTPHTTSTFVKAVAAATGRPFDPFRYD
jgi:hypothetical protein